jgi:hypothetical protein
VSEVFLLGAARAARWAGLFRQCSRTGHDAIWIVFFHASGTPALHVGNGIWTTPHYLSEAYGDIINALHGINVDAGIFTTLFLVTTTDNLPAFARFFQHPLVFRPSSSDLSRPI